MKEKAEKDTQFDPKTLPKTLWQLFMLVIRFIPGEFKRFLPRSLTIGGIILVLHTLLMVVINDGFGPGGGVINPFRPNFLLNTLSYFIDSTTAVRGHFFSSIIFWALLTAVITLLLSGFKNFGGFKRFQGMLFGRFMGVFRIFREKNKKRLVLALTGVAIAAILSFIWRNALVSLMFVFIILRGLVIMQKGGLFHLLARVIHYDFNRFFRGKETDPNKFTIEDTTAVYQGITMGMMLTALPWLESYGLIIGGVTIIVILALRNANKASEMATSLFVLCLIGIGLYLASKSALADDGGWSEYNSNFKDWIRGAGSKRAIALGLFSGFGGALGPIMVSILNGLGLGLGGGVGGGIGGGVGGGTGDGTGGGNQNNEDEGWEDYEDGNDGNEENEGNEEEEEEESNYFLSIQGQKGTLQADGKDSIWFFAKVHSSDPEADPGDLANRTQGISFDFYGSGDDWIQTRGKQMSQGYMAIQVRALAPESADPDDSPSVTISASASGDSDSVSFTLKVAFRPKLEVTFDGGSAVRPDGEDSTILVGSIRCYPDHPDLEAEIAQSIAFQSDSLWVNFGSGSEGGGQKTTKLTAYPPGGDFDTDRPETIEIRVTADYEGDQMEEFVELKLDDLDAWIDVKIDQDTLPVYKKTETYVHAKVMLKAGNESVVSDELTQSLQLRDLGEEGDWLVPSQMGFANDEAYFTVYAWYPYEDPGVDVPATNHLTVYTNAGDKPLEEDIIFNMTPFPKGALVIEAPEESLRPDIEQIIQVRVGLELDPPDPDVVLDDFWASLDVKVEGENDWLILYEGELEGDEKVFDIGCENLSDEADANPPGSLSLVVAGSLFGEPLSETISIQLEPLPLPEIQIKFERAENTDYPDNAVFPDGEDFTTILVSLSMEEEIEGLNLEELTEQLSIDLIGNAANWTELSEEVFEAGAEPVKYLDIYGLLKKAEQRSNMPDSVKIKVMGELTGRAFEKEQSIQLMDVPELSFDFQYDRQLESPIPEDQIALTGEDWIEIQAWFELKPNLESVDQQVIQNEMRFTHLNNSADWFTFTDEQPIEAEGGFLGRSVKVAGIPHPDTPANDIPNSLEIRIECQYLGEEMSERIPIRILGKPVLELDKNEIVLGSGDDEQEITVKAEISNTVDEGWEFVIEPDPNLATVAFEPDKDTCEIKFKPGTLEGEEEEAQDETVKVVARKGDFELEQELKIKLSPIGLFILSEDLLLIPIEDMEASCAYSVRVVRDGKAELATDLMQNSMELTNPIEEAEDDVVRNAFKQAGLTMAFDGFYGETGENAQYAKYKFTIENVLPGPPSQKIEAPITIHVSGQEDDIFTKVFKLQLELQDMEPINAALEKERCHEIVDKYIPVEQRDEFRALIDEQEGLFGAEEYHELRTMIWQAASKMLLEEAAEWDNYADWMGRVETFLSWVEWVCDLAVRVLATATLGPSAGSALMVKTFIKQGLVGYSQGTPFTTTIYNIVVDMIVTKPGDTYLDPDYLAKAMPKPAAYAIYFTYKFLWGIYYDKKTAYQSAKDAFVEVAEDQLVGWLSPKVKEWGTQKGLIPDYSNLPTASNKLYTIDELPPAAKNMANKIKNGKADFDDVINCMKDPQVMRSLKNAPEEVRIAFNKTLKEDFYNHHDAHVENYLRSMPDKEWSGKEIEVRDVGTPGKATGAPDADINTDRDYRAGWVDDDGNFHEIKKEVWQDVSSDKIEEITKCDPEDLRQLATDKYHIEASQEYSDQGFDVIDDPNNPGKKILVMKQKDSSSYEDFKKGDSVALIDPEGMAKMYQEKYEAELRKGDLPQNKSEAMAQSKKAIKTVNGFKKALDNVGADTPDIPDKFKKGMDLVENAAVDHKSDPDGVNKALISLGIPDGMTGLNNYVCAYLESFKNYVPKRDPFSKI